MVTTPAPGSSFTLFNATLLTLEPLAARADGDARVSEDDLGVVRDGVVAVRDGIIEAIGTRSTRAKPEAGAEFDAHGRIVMPGLVDAHTHALFAGDRISDFEAMARGEKPTRGIAYTVEQTRKLDLSALISIGAQHLSKMFAHGTTTAEVKTGYALTAEGEARSLRALAELDERPDLPHVIATFCGAHALPPEFSSYDTFVDELIARILPAAAETGIARFADAFCEQGYFTPAQSRRFLEACAQRNMQLRIHADELSASGGAALAAQLRCTSADHLNYLDLSRRAPARALIDGGVPVALATDFNPGTCPCYSLQEVVHLARRRLKMRVAEAIAGVTVNAARSLDAAGVAGCLARGRPADLIMLDTDEYREFGYYFGVNLVSWASVGRKVR